MNSAPSEPYVTAATHLFFIRWADAKNRREALSPSLTPVITASYGQCSTQRVWPDVLRGAPGLGGGFARAAARNGAMNPTQEPAFADA
jgi:hypothetical protein